MCCFVSLINNNDFKMKKINFLVIALIAIMFAFISCEKNDNEPKEEFIVYNNYINLAGEDNMRDLGGYIGQDGKRVLYRKLFRSGYISELTEADKDSLTNMGLEQVLDLRSYGEVNGEPDNIPLSVDWFHRPLLDGEETDTVDNAAQLAGMMQYLSYGITVDQMMLQTYVVDSFKIAQWKIIFDDLETGKSSLWHCSAGKDRAGMTAVLVLSSLGVSEEVCIADFMKSNDYLADAITEQTAQIAAYYGDSLANVIKPLFGVEQSWIETFLNDIETNHGGMTAFLEELGVDIELMQEKFLEK